MSLKRNILVKNISNLSDARYCAGMGVQIMGFVVDSSDPDYISPDTILEIKEWVEGIEIAIQVGELEEKAILDLISRVNPDLIIVDSTRSLETKKVNCGVYSFSDLSDFQEIDFPPTPSFDGYIFKSVESKDENELTESLEKMNSVGPISVFVEMPNLEKQIEEYSNKWENIGYVLSGGKEIKAGFKDFYELAPVLEYLEEG